MNEVTTQGFIQGPHESVEEFQKRIDYCLTLREHLPEAITGVIPYDESIRLLETANERLMDCYGIRIDWVPVLFSNEKLGFWHGGCAWIFQLDEDGPTTSLIQLRESLRTKTRYCWFYDRDELLVHELCHVGRMMFDESRYEEYFAYQTSKSWFRRLFGPIIQSSTESLVFVLLLFLIIVFDAFLLALGQQQAYIISLWVKTLPCLLIACALWRLYRKHKQMNHVLKKLTEKLGNKREARMAAYRMTDQEIDSL